MKYMYEPLTEEEIEKVIDQTKLGKAPGPDDFTAKFYKTFKSDLTYWFQIVGNDILEWEDASQTCQEAIISLIPKQKTGCPNARNFRSISLLKRDFKKNNKQLYGEDQA